MQRYSRSYVCDEAQHRTVAQFAGPEAVQKLAEKKMLVCSCCGSTNVQVEIASPNYNRGSAGGADQDFTIYGTMGPLENALNVGADFTKQARAIMDGEAPARPLIGTATREEAQQAINDGYGKWQGVPTKKDLN